MGDSLIRSGSASYSDEIEKLAQGELLRRIGRFAFDRLRSPVGIGIKSIGRVGKLSQGVFQGGDEAIRRLTHPVEGLQKGWAALTPMHGMQQRAKELGAKSVQEAAATLKAKIPNKALDPKGHAKALSEYKKFMGGGEHLLGSTPGAGKVQSMAEDLSRRGWTGAGRVTKYMPVGSKSLWGVGFPATTIPSIVNAPSPTPTGEGGALELGLGELAGTGAMIAGTGLGLVPAMGMWYGAHKAGSRLGRVLDRVRGGASFRDATTAPSPQEAQSQLADIQKYYG